MEIHWKEGEGLWGNHFLYCFWQGIQTFRQMICFLSILLRQSLVCSMFEPPCCVTWPFALTCCRCFSFMGLVLKEGFFLLLLSVYKMSVIGVCLLFSLSPHVSRGMDGWMESQTGSKKERKEEDRADAHEVIHLQRTLSWVTSRRGTSFRSFKTWFVPIHEKSLSWSYREAINTRVLVVLWVRIST